jgi:hypothetical protein
VTSAPSIIISGTCPIIDPAVVIALYDGADMLGSSQCATDGTFSVTIPLHEHTYSIVATVVTITGDTGESSQPLTLTYKSPTTAAPTSTTPKPGSHTSTPSPGGPSSNNLEIMGDKPYIVFGPNTDAIWSGSFRGGASPYRITVNWGDGTTDIYKSVGHDKQEYAHHYSRLKAYKVLITITDNAGSSASKSFAAVTPLIFDTGTGTTNPLGKDGVTPTLLLYALYFSLLALLYTLWLQDKHQLIPARARVPKLTTRKPKRRK